MLESIKLLTKLLEISYLDFTLQRINLKCIQTLYVSCNNYTFSLFFHKQEKFLNLFYVQNHFNLTYLGIHTRKNITLLKLITMLLFFFKVNINLYEFKSHHYLMQ